MSILKIQEDINFNPKAIKLKAGEGAWYGLYQNGRVIIEGNPQFIFDKLKEVTIYTDNEIKQLMSDALTVWIIVDADLKKLRGVMEKMLPPSTSLKNILDNILKENKQKLNK